MKRGPLWAILLVAVTLGLILSGAASAQTWHGYSVTLPPRYCNDDAKRFDNYLGDGRVGGFTTTRRNHHLVHIGLTVGLSAATRALTKWSVPVSTFAGAVEMQAPHVRSVFVQRQYPINPGDIVFDFVNPWTTHLVALGWSEHNWKGRFLGLLAGYGAYELTRCYASP